MSASSAASSAYAPEDDWETTAGKFLMQMDAEAAGIHAARKAAEAKDVKAPAVAPPSTPPTASDIVRLAGAGLLTVGAPSNMNTLSYDPDEPVYQSYDQNYSYTLSYSGQVIAYLHAHYNTNDRTKVSTVKAKFNVKSPAAHASKERGDYIMDYAPKSIENAAKALQH